MIQVKNFLSKLIYNNLLWQIILAVFMIGMAAFFISHEHLELVQIRHQIFNTKPLYLVIGILLTAIYIIFQGLMYVYSFKAIKKTVPLTSCILLFLKRNFISVLLPAGGFTSLAFFVKDIEKEGATKSQIYLASALFSFFSILSVLILAIPGITLVLLSRNLSNIELYGLFFLCLLTLILFLLGKSLYQKSKVYKFISKLMPSFIVILDEVLDTQVSKKQCFKILGFSLCIELIGVLHLYISMLAIGVEASWVAAFIGYIVMVILIIASPFLRGLGAIEVSVTYILNQFGYDVLTCASITLLFRFFEFWLILIAGIGSFLIRKDNLLLRILPAFIIFILGVINIISVLTPSIPLRLHLVTSFFSDTFIAGTNIVILVFGLFLIILSVFLLQGSKRACYWGLCFTGLSVLGHLLKGIDYEESILALVSFITLLYTRKAYKLIPHPKLTQVNNKIFIACLAALFGFGIAGFFFMDIKHFGKDFDISSAVITTLKLFLFNNLDVIPYTIIAKNFILAFNISEGIIFIFIAFWLLKPLVTKPYNSDEDVLLAKEIVSKYGKSQLDYFKTYSDKFFFFNDSRDGFISFKVTKHFAVVLEDPVCKDDNCFINLVKTFDYFCIQNGFESVYYRTSLDTLRLYTSLGKKSLPIGEEGIVGLENFSLDGRKMKPNRNAINKLEAESFKFNIYYPPVKEGLLQKLEMVSNDWLVAMRKSEVAFTQGIFDPGVLKQQTIMTIEDKEEKVYAFLNIIPDFAPGEATYDLIRKVSDAPNGVLDMLIIKTFLYLKEQGFSTVNMGLAPLSGIEGVNLKQKTIRYAYENLPAFGHYKGLRKYKEKFFPIWEMKYLIYSHDFHLLQVPNVIKKVSEA